MTITDNLPAVRSAANLPATREVTSTEVGTVRASDRFLEALTNAKQGGRHRLRNPWQLTSLITGGAAVTTAVTAGVIAKVEPGQINNATVATLATIALFVGARGMRARYENRVTSVPPFKPVTKP